MIIILVYLVSRILIIDADLPNFDLSHYAPVDEFFYTYAAFDAIYGINTPDGSYLGPEEPFMNFIHNAMTVPTLIIFGNTYSGLRLPSVLAGLIIILVLFHLFRQRFGILAGVTIAFLFVVDVGFVNASRVAETTIWRFWATILVMWYATSLVKRSHLIHFQTRTSVFGLGFAATAAWVLVYPTNFFIPCACFLIATFLIKNDTKYFTLSTFYVFGCITAFSLYIFVVFIIFGAQVDYFTYYFSIFDGNIGGVKKSWTSSIAQNYSLLFRARFINEFPYFLTLIKFCSLLIFMRIAFHVASNLWDRKRNFFILWVNREDMVIFSFFLLLFAQNVMFNEGAPERKSILFLPLFIYFVFLSTDKILNFKFGELVISKALPLVFLVPFITQNIKASYEETFANPSYYYKDAMIKLTKLGDVRLMSNLSLAFRLYNDTRPLINIYAYAYDEGRSNQNLRNMKKLSENGFATYSIGYIAESTNKTMGDLGFRLEEVIFENRDPRYIYDIGLYRHCPTEAVCPTLELNK